MSQKRKKFAPKNPKKASSSNDEGSDVVIKRLDSLRSNVKEEHKKIASEVPNNTNTKIIGVAVIIIVGMSGIVLLNNFNNSTTITSPNGGQIVDDVGGFRKDTAATPYLSGTKVTLVYIGGLYCPFCAVERWALVEALKTFGNFTNLGKTVSSEDNIGTYDFAGSSYVSNVVDFQPVEIYDNNHRAYESMTTKQSELYNTYGGNSIPFTIIAGAVFKSGSGPNPVVFKNTDFSTIHTQINSKSGTIYGQVSTESSYIQSIINKYIAAATSTTTTTTTA